MNEQKHNTAELQRIQAEEETREHQLADKDPTSAGTAQHERRAAKHAYLRRKLEERERSEREAERRR
jgi:hypothetical protein